jgi:PIN domain nuclease of toxin-antitoxin system
MGRSVLILLDTHVVIWLGLEPARLSKSARTAIDKSRQEGTGLAVSGITLLEITLLSGKKRVSFIPGLEAFLTDIESRFIVLPISARICVRSSSLPLSHPNDPVDRIIASTALAEGLTLITADREIRKSGPGSHHLVIPVPDFVSAAVTFSFLPESAPPREYLGRNAPG